MSEPLAAADFAPHLEQAFTIEGAPFDLFLTNIETNIETCAIAERGAGAPSREPFTLIFSGPTGTALREGLHELKSAAGASFTLYLMPIHTPASDRQDYQAVFN